MQQILDSFEKKNRKKNRQWFWDQNRNQKYSIVLKQSISKPGLYNLTCRVLNLWLTTVGCWKIEDFVWYTLKSACFSSKRTALSSSQDNLTRIPKFLIGNQHSRAFKYSDLPRVTHVYMLNSGNSGGFRKAAENSGFSDASIQNLLLELEFP